MDTIILPDTEVMAFDLTKGEYITVLFTNLELTGTGFRFQIEDTLIPVS